jgi:hypothetical protein
VVQTAAQADGTPYPRFLEAQLIRAPSGLLGLGFVRRKGRGSHLATASHGKGSRMRFSYRLFRVFGVDVRVHVTFIFIVA